MTERRASGGQLAGRHIGHRGDQSALQAARGVRHPLVDGHLHDDGAIGRRHLLQPDLVEQLPQGFRRRHENDITGSRPADGSYARVMADTVRTELPPGPRLPAAVQAALMARYWPRFISACRRRYGSVFTMRIATMGTLVYLDDPAEIKKVFAGSPERLSRR